MCDVEVRFTAVPQVRLWFLSSAIHLLLDLCSTGQFSRDLTASKQVLLDRRLEPLFSTDFWFKSLNGLSELDLAIPLFTSVLIVDKACWVLKPACYTGAARSVPSNLSSHDCAGGDH